ncbi:MAG: hypothetical protein FWE22_08465 [Firmicutes bacterium]|nr:hypothetical protein [Bacillota bacterium]
MSYYNRNRNNNRRRRNYSNSNYKPKRRGFFSFFRRNKPKYSQIEKQAYQQGLIERGIQNKNSRVYESYEAGKNAQTGPKEKKPLV